MDQKNKSFHDENAPHNDLVGLLIGFCVVVIVMNGIFHNWVWFAFIPQIVLFLLLLKEATRYIQDRETRANYKYSTSQESLWNIWIAYIIVSIVMSVIFHGNVRWIGRIPTTVLSIIAIETTITYILTQKQKKVLENNNSFNAISTNIGPNSTNSQLSAQISYVTTPNHTNVSSRFCPLCGEPHNNVDVQFCPHCGAKLSN